MLSGATVAISGLSFKDSKTSSQGFIDNEGSLTLSNSSVSGNEAREGGGITNEGSLTLSNSSVSGNTASASGGIYNAGSLTLNNSSVSGNRALGDPGLDGGIGNAYGGTLMLTNSTISGNIATVGEGGGIGSIGVLTLANSTISGNSAFFGGGIDSSGLLTLANSTISDNTASDGGGISIRGGTLMLTNSTVSGNTAFSGGGGIFIQSHVGQPHITQADFTFSTIYGNTAQHGGDIAIEDFDYNGKPIKQQLSQVRIRNSIVAADPTHPSPDPDIVGMLTSGGYNLFQDKFGGATFDPAGTLHNTDQTRSVSDLKIDPVLQDNHGSTKPHTLTHALLPGSPAIDAIPLHYCQIEAIFNSQLQMYTDQRGVKRPDGNDQLCDIGAYEYPNSSP